MRRLCPIAAIAWLLVAPAMAGQPLGMRNPQVSPANASAGLPASDDNLAAGGYPIAGGICAEWGHQVPCNNHYSTVRASTKYVSASDGMFTSVTANFQAMGSGNGSLIEESGTNLALWARDLTQSGTWIAVTMTAAKNAVGIDGAANSATTLTSTSAAGTILQSLTQASAAYTYTVYVKGITVTGAIQVADYPVLTPAFTTLSSANCFNPAGTGVSPASGQAGFLRCTVTATSLNPVIGFKFANSGDSIVVDFNQLEAAGFGTSPILTTSATAARAADNISLAGMAKTAMQGTSFSTVIQTNGTVGSSGILEGSADDILRLETATSLRSTFGVTTLTAVFGSGSYAGLAKNGLSVGPSTRSLVVNNGTVVTDTTAISANTIFTLGSFNGSSIFLDAYFPRITLWSNKVPDASLKAFTQ